MGLRSRKPLLVAGKIVTGIVMGSMLLHALLKVMSGNGLETYRNYKGALLNYAGAVVTGVVLVLCVVAAYGMKWWHHRQERRFEEIVRARENAANTAEEKTPRTDS